MFRVDVLIDERLKVGAAGGMAQGLMVKSGLMHNQLPSLLSFIQRISSSCPPSETDRVTRARGLRRVKSPRQRTQQHFLAEKKKEKMTCQIRLDIPPTLGISLNSLDKVACTDENVPSPK